MAWGALLIFAYYFKKIKMTKSILIIATSLIFALTGCNQTNSKTQDSSVGNNKSEPQKWKVFDNPIKLCAILSQNGIGELKEWKNPMDLGWGTLTDYHQFGQEKEGVGIQNNIAYYLEGTETSVSNLTIILNINNADDKKNALMFLAEVTEKTFSSLNLIIPTGLIKAIRASKTFKGEINGFVVLNKLEKSKIETWKVVIKKK